MKDFATIDFETYYDKDFSLSKLQTDSYVLDSRFEIIGVGVKPSLTEETLWYSGTKDEIKRFLEGVIDWPRAAVCAHNTLFDGFICTQVLGLRPKLWLDTLGMSRAMLPWLPSHSLASISKALELGEKGNEIINAAGKRRCDFSEQALAAYAAYCKNDVELTAAIAVKLFDEGFPIVEAYIQDMVIRMFTEPKLHGDVSKLKSYYEKEVARKQELINKAGVDSASLMSNNKFAELLRKFGCEPPTKISPTTGRRTYAFAKSDKELITLLGHENPDVQALVAARLGVKTTIAETRALRLLEAAKRSPMPVYLNYWGAKTTGRLSGGNQINWQNIPARGPGAELREAIVAPEGHSIVVGDSSNIELRVALAAAGQNDYLSKLANGEDLYCDFASKLYGRQITAEDELERTVGKIALLSLQYGAGAARFLEMVRLWAKITLSESEAASVVSLYRKVFNKVAALWDYCSHKILPSIYRGEVLVPVDVHGWYLTNGSGFSLPGMPGVVYKKLQKTVDNEWVYDNGKGHVRIYGGKVVENLCQHAARNIVMAQTLLINARFPVALSVHDEVVCVVPDEQVDECKEYMKKCLSTAPAWCMNKLPLSCKVGVAKNYRAAKH